MMNFREICKTIFFCIVSVNLGVSSGLEILGFLFAALFVVVHVKQYMLLKKFSMNSSQIPLERSFEYSALQRKIPRYRKLFAYGAIVPFALWWLLTPSVENGVSPYLVFIPAWYLLYLAWLQKRSLGNGGFEVFVVFNGVAVLFMGLFQAPRGVAVSAVIALLLAVYVFGRPRVALYKRLLFVLLYASLCGSSYLGFKYWKSNRYYSGRWAEDYYLKNRVMGFDPVAALGSFSSNYNSKYNNEIILRIWDTLAPPYLRAAAYEKYVAGIWKLPTTAEKKLYPARYRVDYAVFETEDSITISPNIKTVWVQATLDNFGFMFAAPNAVGVASKNADSLDYYSTNVFAGANGTRSDWFYYVPDTAAALAVTASPSDRVDSAFLQIPEKDLILLDSVAVAMALPTRNFANVNSANSDSVVFSESQSESQFAVQNLKAIENYFIKNFKYSYVVSWRKNYAGMSMNSGVSNMKNMLALFWKNKEGYCEYYATLATLLLRHQGIPARYVTGFAHPEHVEGRPYVTFRRRHSHAWVEVYIDHKWYIFDPTPPVLVNAFAESSWFSKKIEGLKGRVSYVLHLLKDGEWRRVVDSWQNVSERFVANPVLYGVLILLVVVFAGIRLRKYRRNRISHSVSKDAERWIFLLESAEKRLARMGFVRASGETVSAFMVRIKQTMMAQQSARQTIKKASPKDSRFEKDCLSLLKQLEDYENNRWR